MASQEIDRVSPVGVRCGARPKQGRRAARVKAEATRLTAQEELLP
jgi:hypothetical protein